MRTHRHQTSLPEGHPYISHLVRRVTLEEAEQKQKEESVELARTLGDDPHDPDWEEQSAIPLDITLGSDEGTFSPPSGGADNEQNRLTWTEEWEAFKACLRPGDELWYFCSPQENWDALCGSEGYVIIRQGSVVRDIETSFN